MNVAGGTHHAHRTKPGAFCMLNDQAIAANYLIDNKLSSKIMIIDLDVHQVMELLPYFKIKILYLHYLFMVEKIIHLENKKVILIWHLKMTQMMRYI